MASYSWNENHFAAMCERFEKLVDHLKSLDTEAPNRLAFASHAWGLLQEGKPAIFLDIMESMGKRSDYKEHKRLKKYLTEGLPISGFAWRGYLVKIGRRKFCVLLTELEWHGIDLVPETRTWKYTRYEKLVAVQREFTCRRIAELQRSWFKEEWHVGQHSLVVEGINNRNMLKKLFKEQRQLSYLAEYYSDQLGLLDKHSDRMQYNDESTESDYIWIEQAIPRSLDIALLQAQGCSWLIGDGGIGKSVAVQRCIQQKCQSELDCFPIYIEPSQFISTAEESPIDNSEVMSIALGLCPLLASGIQDVNEYWEWIRTRRNVVIVIDGLDSFPESVSRKLLLEFDLILGGINKGDSGMACFITSRFHPSIRIGIVPDRLIWPLPFNSNQREQYFQRAVHDATNSGDIYRNSQSYVADRLLANPLHAKLYADLLNRIKPTDTAMLPRSSGHLYELIIECYYEEWEEDINNRILGISIRLELGTIAWECLRNGANCIGLMDYAWHMGYDNKKVDWLDGVVAICINAGILYRHRTQIGFCNMVLRDYFVAQHFINKRMPAQSLTTLYKVSGGWTVNYIPITLYVGMLAEKDHLEMVLNEIMSNVQRVGTLQLIREIGIASAEDLSIILDNGLHFGEKHNWIIMIYGTLYLIERLDKSTRERLLTIMLQRHIAADALMLWLSYTCIGGEALSGESFREWFSVAFSSVTLFHHGDSIDKLLKYIIGKVSTPELEVYVRRLQNVCNGTGSSLYDHVHATLK